MIKAPGTRPRLVAAAAAALTALCAAPGNLAYSATTFQSDMRLLSMREVCGVWRGASPAR
jgi:hypothetical protein